VRQTSARKDGEEEERAEACGGCVPSKRIKVCKSPGPRPSPKGFELREGGGILKRQKSRKLQADAGRKYAASLLNKTVGIDTSSGTRSSEEERGFRLFIVVCQEDHISESTAVVLSPEPGDSNEREGVRVLPERKNRVVHDGPGAGGKSRGKKKGIPCNEKISAKTEASARSD